MKRLFALVLAVVVGIGCWGCGLADHLKQQSEGVLVEAKEKVSAFIEYMNEPHEYVDPEDVLIEDTYAALFAALDSGDADAILALFAENVRKQDKDIESEVQQMLDRWPGNTELWYYDGVSSGAYSTRYGVKTAEVTAMIPAFAGGETFWVLIDVVYRDDQDEKNEGVTRMLFYTAEDYCRLREDQEYKYPDGHGLYVFAEEPDDPHVVCIDQYPVRMADAEPLDPAEVAEFIESSRSWAAFTARFGQPHGTNGGGVRNAYYWLEPENGELRVLDLGVTDSQDEIWGVYVDDELKQYGIWEYLGIPYETPPTETTK